MTLVELREEYRSVRIGEKILEEVRQTVHQVCRRYDPQIYGRAASWDDAEGDLVQNVVLDLLLAEGQLDYLMSTAVELGDFQNLLKYQVRRYMARKRQRTVIDNLIDRTKVILAEGAFEKSGSGDTARYCLAGVAVEQREPSEEELLSAARSSALVPWIRFSKRERAPAVYTRENLVAVLRAVGIAMPTSFSTRDLAKIFALVLTDWVAGFLYDFEEAHTQPSSILGPEEEAMVESAAKEILEGCEQGQLLVLKRKFENLTDQAIADELGVSRQTVIARKKEVVEILRTALDDLPGHVHAAVMDRVAIQIASTPAIGPS